jgi:hypothetical protein
LNSSDEVNYKNLPKRILQNYLPNIKMQGGRGFGTDFEEEFAWVIPLTVVNPMKGTSLGCTPNRAPSLEEIMS